MGKLVEEILTAAAISVLADEMKSLLCVLSAWSLVIAVRLLPCGYRERYAEEWASHLVELPSPISKLVFAVSLMPTGLRVRADLWFESRHANEGIAPYSRLYRFALGMLVVLAIRHQLRKVVEWFGFRRPRTKFLGIDCEALTAIILVGIVWFCGRQIQLLRDGNSG
jgi:hypothetical protein